MADQVVGIKINVEGSDAGKSVGGLKQQLREAQKAVGELSEKFGATSQAAIDAAKKAAKLKDAIGDAKTLTDAFNPDAKFKAFSSALQGVVGGFTAVQGAQALFGSESEDLTKTLAKVQGAMAFSQGIDSILEAKDSFVTLGAKIKGNVVTAFNSLKGAIGATGIGLLVIGLGLLVTNFDKVKKAVMNLIPGLSSVADFIGGLVNKVTDFIGVTSESGRITEKLIADNEKAIKNGERFLDLNADKYDEYTQRKIKANLEFKKKQNEFLQDEKLSEAEKNEYIRQAREKANREIFKVDADRAAKAEEARKKESDKIKADAEKRKQEQKVINDELSKARQEAFLAGITDEQELEEEKLRLGILNRQKEIENLKASESQKAELLKLANIKYWADLAVIENKFAEERKKKEEEDAKLQIEKEKEKSEIFKELNQARIDAIANTYVKAQELEAQRFQDEIDKNLELLNAKKISQEEYNAWRENAETIHSANLLKINKDNADAQKKIDEEKFKNQQELISMTANLLNQFSDLIGQQTAAGKALAIASATIDTYVAANKALKADYTMFGPAAQVARIIAVTSTILTGIKNVREIAKVKVPGGGGGGGSVSTPSMPGVSAPVGMAPSNTLLNQQLINQQGNAAVRSFVLESDVSGNQERIRRLNRAARIN